MAKRTKDFSQQVGGVLGSALTPEPDLQELAEERSEPPASTRRFGTSSVKTLSPLSTAEAAQLAELEATIDRGMNTFVEVGRALIEIQESKLYRATHLTIEQYMLDRFNLNRNRGYQLIDAAKVVRQIADEIKTGTTELTDDPAEGYQAIPTGKVRRAKPQPPTDKQPQDVDYTEETADSSGATGSDAEPTAQASGDTSYVWSAPEEEDDDGDNQNEGVQPRVDVPDMPLPSTESHAAALAQLPEDQRTNIWKKTVADSQQDGKPITASRIKKTAEKSGVPLNKKAPRDRAPSKNAFGKNTETNDDFSEEALQQTRQALTGGASWLPPETNGSASDIDLSVESNEGGSEESQLGMSVAPAGSRQALSEAFSEKIGQAMPGEITITLRGSFLIRQDFDQSWQKLRGDDREINEQYTDTLTVQEFLELIGLNR